MNPIEDDFTSFLAARERMLIAMDVQLGRRLLMAGGMVDEDELDDETVLVAMHKTRYEVPSMPKAMREASQQWLQQRGYTRMRGLPWPDALPDGSMY